MPKGGKCTNDMDVSRITAACAAHPPKTKKGSPLKKEEPLPTREEEKTKKGISPGGVRILNNKMPWLELKYLITCLLCEASLEFRAQIVQSTPASSTSFFGGLSSTRYSYFVVCPCCDEVVDVASVIPEWVKRKLRGEKPVISAEAAPGGC